MENKSLFFDIMKNGQIFSSKVYHFQTITDSFLVEKRGTLERARRHVWVAFVLAFFKLLIIEENHLGRDSTSHFLQNILIITSNVYF